MRRRRPGRPPRQNVSATKRLIIRLTPKELSVLEAKSERAGSSKSDYVRHLIEAAR